MTQRNFFELVANGTMNDEIIAFAQKAINEADSKRNAQQMKKDAENAPLVEKMREYLAGGTVKTASQIGEALSISTSKVTALAKKMSDLKVSEVCIDKRIVKGYSL